MDDLPVDDSSPTRKSTVQGTFRVSRREWSIRRDSHKAITFNWTDLSVGRLAQSSSILGDHIEDRLQFRRTSCNGLENFAGRGLMLDRKSTRLNSSHHRISY